MKVAQDIQPTWLGSIQRHRVVADVLSGEENTESQSIQKIPGREKSSHRAKREASATLQEGRDILHLWNVVLRKATVFFHERDNVKILLTGILLVHTVDKFIHLAPCIILNLRVFNSWDFISGLVLPGHRAQKVSPFAISWVVESRVI